jgi:hypothetical protein
MRFFVALLGFSILPFIWVSTDYPACPLSKPSNTSFATKAPRKFGAVPVGTAEGHGRYSAKVRT